MKACGGVDVYSRIFLTMTIVECEWSVHSSVALPPGERTPCFHWIGVCVGSSAGLNDVEKRILLTLPGLEF
jgi:hypothetical protein